MSNKTKSEAGYNPGGLLDALIVRHGLWGDAGLSRFMGVSAPAISIIRSQKKPVGASFILKCVERGDMTVAEVRAFIGGAA